MFTIHFGNILNISMDENSISIINRTNGQVTGEKAGALPVRVMSNFSWVQYIFIGFLVAIFVLGYFVWTIQKEVVIVEVSGKSPDFTIFEIE